MFTFQKNLFCGPSATVWLLEFAYVCGVFVSLCLCVFNCLMGRGVLHITVVAKLTGDDLLYVFVGINLVTHTHSV